MIDYFNHTRGVSAGNSGDFCCGGRQLNGGLDWNRGNLTPCSADNGKYTEPLLVAQATAFLQRQAASKQPWFLYMPFHLVHLPNQVPDSWLERYPAAPPPANITQRVCASGGAEGWAKCRIVLAMESALDDAVGTVMAALDANKLSSNTITVFSSDNGAPLSQGGSNFPLRGQKMQLWEVRNPLSCPTA